MKLMDEITFYGPFLVNDLQTPLFKKSHFDFMILNGDVMILNDGLCIEKKEKKNNNFPIFSF